MHLRARRTVNIFHRLPYLLRCHIVKQITDHTELKAHRQSDLSTIFNTVVLKPSAAAHKRNAPRIDKVNLSRTIREIVK